MQARQPLGGATGDPGTRQRGHGDGHVRHEHEDHKHPVPPGGRLGEVKFGAKNHKGVFHGHPLVYFKVIFGGERATIGAVVVVDLSRRKSNDKRKN